MRGLVGVTLVTGCLISGPAWAHDFCNNENSCAKLACKRTCEDVWQGDQCLGGYCPKGLTALDNQSHEDGKKLELHLYNVSPQLQTEIRKLIDKGM